MNNFSFRLFFRLLTLWFGLNGGASAMDKFTDITLSPLPLYYSAPAEATTPGNIMGATWTETMEVAEVIWCDFIFVCATGTVEPSSTIQSAGFSVTLNGARYNVFETSVPGIGYIVAVKDYNATHYMPLQMAQVQTFPADDAAPGYSPSLGWSIKVTFVKTGEKLQSGSHRSPLIHVAVLTAIDSANVSTMADVYINPTTFIVKAAGCTVDTDSVDLKLGNINLRELPAIGSTSPAANFTIDVDCDENIALNAVVTDQSNPDNRSTVVSLTGDSTAAGVGVEFFYNGTGPLKLGPDSAARGTANQFFIQRTGQAQRLSLPFQARYIRTGELTPGSANALASVTFSYQ
ncbi:F17b-G fimbrial adhesin [Mixta theicola]|nr:fimbrial protein [Mixta theicola]QHM76279.1 F17b-G fimbrial adhesin [Mixta theicola]